MPFGSRISISVRIPPTHRIISTNRTGEPWCQVRGWACFVTRIYTKWLFHSSPCNTQLYPPAISVDAWLTFCGSLSFSRGQPLPHYVVGIVVVVLSSRYPFQLMTVVCFACSYPSSCYVLFFSYSPFKHTIIVVFGLRFSLASV